MQIEEYRSRMRYVIQPSASGPQIFHLAHQLIENAGFLSLMGEIPSSGHDLPR